jgi:hypothetical protein
MLKKLSLVSLLVLVSACTADRGVVTPMSSDPTCHKACHYNYSHAGIRSMAPAEESAVPCKHCHKKKGEGKHKHHHHHAAEAKQQPSAKAMPKKHSHGDESEK